jgi:phosphatidylglycerophosphate synthase
MMFDKNLRVVIDPPLNAMGRGLVRLGFDADLVTLVGLGCGLIACALVAFGLPGLLALGPLALGRLADGLDGAVARASAPTDFGGFLDIVADFTFYGALPLAFAFRDPARNALPAGVLLLAFYINGASFLAFAALAAKRGIETAAQGEKSLYFSAGLMEGTETIAFFVAFCLWPNTFPALAVIFALLCLVTAGGRVLLAARMFREQA